MLSVERREYIRINEPNERFPLEETYSNLTSILGEQYHSKKLRDTLSKGIDKSITELFWDVINALHEDAQFLSCDIAPPISCVDQCQWEVDNCIGLAKRLIERVTEEKVRCGGIVMTIVFEKLKLRTPAVSSFRELNKALAQLMQDGRAMTMVELNLSGRDLTTIPHVIHHFKGLINLNLSGNRLRYLPKGLVELTQLKQLNLLDNPIQEMPLNLANMTSLESLYMDQERATELAERLKEFPCLRKMYFRLPS